MVLPTVGFFGTVNRTPRELKGTDGAFAEASSKVKGRCYKVTKKSTVLPTVGFFGTVNRAPRELKGADGAFAEASSKVKGRCYEVTKQTSILAPRGGQSDEGKEERQNKRDH